jgi:hypothetical protein
MQSLIAQAGTFEVTMTYVNILWEVVMKQNPADTARWIQEKINENVEQHGFHLQYVFADENTPSFIYTIGMTNIGAPELIIFGLPPEAVGGPLNQLFNEIRMHNRPTDEKKLADLWSVTMLLEAVDKDVAGEYTVQFDEYYLDKNTKPVYKQILWPDTNGKYPHQHGFDEKYRASQPYIGKRHPRLDDDCGVEYSSLH